MAAALALGRLEKPMLMELLPLVLSGGRVDAGPGPLGGGAQTTDDSPSKRGSSGGQSKKQEGVAGGSEEGEGGLQHVASVLRAMESLGLPHETVWLLNTTASLLVQSVDYHRPQVSCSRWGLQLRLLCGVGWALANNICTQSCNYTSRWSSCARRRQRRRRSSSASSRTWLTPRGCSRCVPAFLPCVCARLVCMCVWCVYVRMCVMCVCVCVCTTVHVTNKLGIM